VIPAKKDAKCIPRACPVGARRAARDHARSLDGRCLIAVSAARDDGAGQLKQRRLSRSDTMIRQRCNDVVWLREHGRHPIDGLRSRGSKITLRSQLERRAWRSTRIELPAPSLRPTSRKSPCGVGSPILEGPHRRARAFRRLRRSNSSDGDKGPRDAPWERRRAHAWQNDSR